jgi:hypothetical protein
VAVNSTALIVVLQSRGISMDFSDERVVLNAL